MAESKESIIVFEDVSASVGGVDISSIAELSLSAATNGIPSVTLLIDAGMSGNVQTYVDFVSLGTAGDKLSAFRDMVKKDSATLSLSLTCRNVTSGSTDSLNLSGWILTDVSISPIQRKGNCCISLTFSHPVCKAAFGGFAPGLLGATPNLDTVTGSNPLAVFVSAMEVYADTQRGETLTLSIPGSADSGAVREALITHLRKAVSNFQATLSWEGPDMLPAENHLGGWSDLIRKGISAYAMPGLGTSVLHTFLSTIVPECSLCVGGDYTGSSLSVRPLNPWASSSLSIDESDIISLSFPAKDPAPLSGVKVEMGVSYGESGITFMPEVAPDPDSGKPIEAYYVPESQLSADYLYGPLNIVQQPGWLAQTYAYRHPVGSSYVSDAGLAASGGLYTAVSVPRGGEMSMSGGGGGGGGMSSEAYGNAMMACAKAYYESMLMSNWTFTVNTRILLPSAKKLFPGSVMSVSAASKEVLSGYVVGVEHIISVESRSAHTRIVCTHPRFGKLPDGVSGTGNALYS